MAVLAASGTALGTGEKEAAVSSDKVRENRRSLFSGHEARFAQFAWLRPDCTSIVPDIRIISAPKKGTVRFEKARSIATASTSAVQKKCFGKPVDVVSLYYRSDEKFNGPDKLVLNVDSKLGHILRYTYLISVEASEPGLVIPQKAQGVESGAESVKDDLTEIRIDRVVLKGNEARIAAPNNVNADCSSGPVPNLRIVTAPANGAYRFEETSIPVDRKPDNSRAVCNGKPVSAVAVYYSAKPDFTGNDKMVVDVDFKNGTVRRFFYAIVVR